MKKNDFAILNALRADSASTQRDLAKNVELSLGTVNGVLRQLRADGLVDEFSITEKGYEALAPYKVENAIIMAAGLSSRFAPLSYEKPKGTLEVRGEVLVERQIRQLQEAGITDITVVVGYMKESFFYLEDKFGVTIRVNEEYSTRNNNSTLMLVREKLGNTFICSSDNYFTENVYEPYVYDAYYATVYAEGETDEYWVKTGIDDVITEVVVGGSDVWFMSGHAYFNRAFSEKFVQILEREYDWPETAPKLWEDIYSDHVNELHMVCRKYAPGIIYEFDSLDELRDFDQDFLENVDSSILDNICEILKCSRQDVVDIVPLKAGLTNLSFKFVVDGTPYVYRHPGVGTEKIIIRDSELFSQKIAKELGIDETFIYQDKDEAWKLSRFVEDCIPFDYHNKDHVEKAMELIRALHTCDIESDYTYRLVDKAQAMIDSLDAMSYPSFPDFNDLYNAIQEIDKFASDDNVPECLCHNDFYQPNFLVTDEDMYLIDWEYSAMSDYASDLGVFICCSDYTEEEADEVIRAYFQGEPTFEQYRHCIAYVAIAAYHWFIWALWKQAMGDPVGEFLYIWYRCAKSYSEKALKLYREGK